MKINGKPSYQHVAFMSTTIKERLDERLKDLSFVDGSNKKDRLFFDSNGT